MLLQEIVSKLSQSVIEEAGLTLHGLRVEPGPDGVVLSFLPRPAPCEAGAAFLTPAQAREIAELLVASAQVIEGVAKPL